MTIAGLEVGPEQPCRVVAEISNNHNGDLGNALVLIDECADAGVDFIKFQAYTAEELVALRGDGKAPEPWGSQGWTMRRLYDKAKTPLHWFPKLAEKCAHRGVPWFASAFGLGSFTFMEAMGCPVYKLAALDYGKRSLRQMVERAGKPIIRSCPGNTRPGPARHRVGESPLVRLKHPTALWCPPGYPQDVTGLRAAMRRFDGFSFHGRDPFVPALAAAYGASMVEVHVQLDDVPSELEANVSLTVSQLAELVTMCKTARRVA